jgi:hypothetical protein
VLLTMRDDRLLDLGQSANTLKNVGCASLILNAEAISSRSCVHFRIAYSPRQRDRMQEGSPSFYREGLRHSTDCPTTTNCSAPTEGWL